ncbi:MAG: hypothetical protein MI919_24905 [Holophagales bacterium]|nr:hypothetical protein [Holophagales bacterium]
MDAETLQSTAGILLVIVVYLGGPVFLLAWLYRHPEWWLAKYPEWIYGMETRLRLNVKRAFAVGFLLWALTLVLGGIIGPVEGDAAWQLPLALLVAIPLGVATARAIEKPRRVFERTYDQGILVIARIRKSRQRNLACGRYVIGGSELGAQATVMLGAALIWSGPWSMEIEFELDGQSFEDSRRVSSQAYYRFRDSKTLPILVRPEDPKSWVPVLGELPKHARDRPSAESAA